MKYTIKMLLDEVGISTPTFYRTKKANEEFFNQHSETIKGVCSYDDEVLAWLKAEFPTKQKASQNAPEAPETPVEASDDSNSVIGSKTELDALQAKLDALQALYDKQLEITEIYKGNIEQLKADKANQQNQIAELHQLLAREQEHTLRLNPPVTVEPPADAEPTDDEADEAEPERKHGKLYRWFHRRKDKE